MLEGITEKLREVYEERSFPFLLLIGFTIATGFTDDPYWLLVGVGGFVLILWQRRKSG